MMKHMDAYTFITISVSKLYLLIDIFLHHQFLGLLMYNFCPLLFQRL